MDQNEMTISAYRKRLKLVTFLLLSVVFFLCSKFVFDKYYKGTAVAVDGDTIQMGSGKTIDLWGIQAPGMRSKFGMQSKFALDVIINKKKIKCLDRSGPLRVGPSIASCSFYDPEKRNSVDIAEVMVSLGYAVVRKPENGGHYEANMNEAIKARSGMWKAVFEEYEDFESVTDKENVVNDL